VTTTLVAQPPEVDAPERGTTTVADRVVAAVAGRAASEVPGVGGAARRLMGVAVDSAGALRAPQVEVTVAGETVALHIRLSIAYPAPVRATAERVRRHVAERVELLAGKKVGVVDVTVVALPVPAVPARVVR
jgi:uncharacterized alkaline shock family protein YloU